MARELLADSHRFFRQLNEKNWSPLIRILKIRGDLRVRETIQFVTPILSYLEGKRILRAAVR